VLKAIIEVPLLTEGQTVGAALAAERGGAHIVKTSTGFKGLKLRSTSDQDVRLLRRTLRPETGIKAAGGIRTTAEALAMIEAGATRIGTSSGVAILAGLQE
jgi:deoxyribose-phosphate aldolase